MKVLFFARIREQVKTDIETWSDLENINVVKDVLDRLKTRGEPWCSALSDPNILIAINQEICNEDTTVHNSDEIAFMPPVTGG